MKRLNDAHSLHMADMYFGNKVAIEQLEAENKAILAQLHEGLGGEDGYVGNHKLSMVRKAGSVSYARIVKEKLRGLDLEPYRGAPSQHLQLK